MTPILKPPPVLRGGNLLFYRDRSPESLGHGAAGTGKTLASLFKLVHLATIFPKTRWFILRKTKASLAESVLVTLERDVFGESSPILTSRPMMRKTRDHYELPNGSVIVTAGMDKPEKLFSTEYNGGYVPEATELELEEWESLKRALRAPFLTAMKLKDQPTPVPFYQLWGDCNPSYNHHWLKKRIEAGVLSGHRSVHEDNPRYHDGTQFTPAGREYLEKQLGSITPGSFMWNRLMKGEWCAAEGLVYDEFNETIHVLPSTFTIPASWQRYWAIDFGYTDPLCLQFWAKDGDGRLYLYREYYHTGKLVEDVAAWAWEEIKMKREPRPVGVVCDHDPENAETFKRHCGGIYIELADKADRKGGIQSVKSRLRVAGDGKPRLFVVRGALHMVDRSLSRAGKPTSFLEEVQSYCWDAEKDLPMDGNDHACDSARYLVSFVDSQAGSKGVW